MKNTPLPPRSHWSTEGPPAQDAPGWGYWNAPPPDPAGMFAETPESELHISEVFGMIWSHRWLVLTVLLVTVVLGTAYGMTRPRLYRATVVLNIDASKPVITPGQYNAGPSWWERDTYLHDQLFVMRTPRVAMRAAQRLGLMAANMPDANAAAGVLLGALQVEPIKDSNLLTLSMVGTSPERIAEWANMYAQVFIETSIEDNIDKTRQVYKVISDRLDPLRKQVADSEQRLVDFRTRQDGLLFADQDKNVISEQVNTLTTEYAQAKSDRIRLESRLSALTRLHESGMAEAAFSDVLNDDTIQGLRQERGKLRAELDDKLRTYKPEHPVIQDLKARIAGLDQRLKDQIETLLTSTKTDYEIARGREQSLYSNIQQLKQQSIELSRQTLELEKLRRAYDQDKTFFEQMVARSKEVDLSANVTMNNVSVVQPAQVPGAPFRPNLPLILGASLITGLALGVGSALGLTFLDQTMRTPDQIERYLNLDVLTAVPKFKEGSKNVLRESFQALRTALLLASRSEGCQIVMVTSATPSEGKTTVSFNLARVLASGGERVLLIDGDLRRPRLHRLVSSKNVRGLTSVVLGEREVRDVITALADVPNLDVVTSGPLPPNPPELFSKSSFAAMLEGVRKDYDWVVIDTPPVVSVTDAVICSRVVDMALLVVQYGGPRRQLIREALKNLRRSGVHIPGAVINRVDVERSYYYYSSYYSSHYYTSDPAPVTEPGSQSTA